MWMQSSKDLKGGGHGLIWLTTPALARRGLREQNQLYNWNVDISLEIWNRSFLVTNLQIHKHAKRFVLKHAVRNLSIGL